VIPARNASQREAGGSVSSSDPEHVEGERAREAKAIKQIDLFNKISFNQFMVNSINQLN